MKDHGGFLLSTAVIVVELWKLLFSAAWIVVVRKQSVWSIVDFVVVRRDKINTLLLVMIPAICYVTAYK